MSFTTNLRSGLEKLISSVTPNLNPSIKFKNVNDNEEIGYTSFGTKQLGTRAFQVTIGPKANVRTPDYLDWNGGWLQYKDYFKISIRYDIPSEKGGYAKLCDMIAEDARQLIHALHPLTNGAIYDNAGAVVNDLKPTGTFKIDKIANDGKVIAEIAHYYFEFKSDIS